MGLTLVGQYLTQTPPEDASYKALQSINRAIAGIRSPYFSGWITLHSTLRRNGDKIHLDFFPEFYGALAEVQQSCVEVLREYGLDHGHRWQGLNFLEAFLALRNGSAHSGVSRDDICSRDIGVFRPYLDNLLHAFDFLPRFDLLVLRSSLDDEEPLVQLLRGPRPPAPAFRDLTEDLYKAFEFSPVVIQGPDGRIQGLFPLFHGHIEGEPLRCYDGHYVREDPLMRRRTIYYLGKDQRLPLEDQESTPKVLSPAPHDAGEKLRQMLEVRQIPWHIRREDVTPWTLRDLVNDYARRTPVGGGSYRRPDIVF